MQTTSDSNILALDVGEKRIGVALANNFARIPSPFRTIDNTDAVWDELSHIIRTEHVTKIIVGLPRGLDGQDTAQTSQVRDFGDVLQQKLCMDIEWQDEALTSHKAETELSARHKPYDKGMIDALAATYILEDYLRENQERQQQ